MSDKKESNLRVYAIVSGFAISMIVVIGGMLFLGILVDRWLSLSPLFTILFGLLGIIAGIVQLIRMVSKWE